MIHHYQDYYWKSGKPYGRGKIDPTTAPSSYKIIIDPYFRRFSIEKYSYTSFEKSIYDSILLDFRRLKAAAYPMEWRQEVSVDAGATKKCLMRNEEDRLILSESYEFEQGFCRSCKLSSIHGIELSTHRLYYTELGDSFNGVILFDLENRPVMIKKYDLDPSTKEFSLLLDEEWNMEYLSIDKMCFGN